MKIKTLLMIVIFLISSLFIPGDGYSKGGGRGGRGGGFGRGGKFSGGFGMGNKRGRYVPPGHGSASGSYYRGGSSGLFFLGGVGTGFFYSSSNACYSCHPRVGWFDRFRRCSYIDSNSPDIAEGRTLTERDYEILRTWEHGEPYIGP
jgi:hypothetical protein